MGEHNRPVQQLRALYQFFPGADGRLTFQVLALLTTPNNDMPDGKMYSEVGRIIVSATTPAGVEDLMEKLGKYYAEKKAAAEKLRLEAEANGTSAPRADAILGPNGRIIGPDAIPAGIMEAIKRSKG